MKDTMSSTREIEHHSASAATFTTNTALLTPTQWRIATADDYEGEYASLLKPGDDDAAPSTNTEAAVTPCTALSSNQSIRISPMERSHGGWDDVHFHTGLRIPEGGNVGRGLVVMLEAMGRECLAVALSPYHSYDLGKTYVVHFGANGNMQTVLRRHVNYTEAIDVTFPSRVCAETSWVPYWIVLQNGKLSAGVGKVPGKHCIGVMDDTMYNMLRSGVDAVRYVGIGNSALQRNARDVRVRNVMVTAIPEHFGLTGSIPVEEDAGFVNILDMGYGANTSTNVYGPTDAELLAEYEKERIKAKARAAKFGVEYKEPAPDAFMKWSEARRLRANPERGFITGIDTFSTEEKAKADARKERFAKEERKRKMLHSNPEGESDEQREDGEDEMEQEDGVDDVAEWEKTKRDPLATEQAWDNWELVKKFRVDPPTSKETNNVQLTDTFSNDVWHGSEDATMEKPEDFIPQTVTIVPTKIHIFSIDHQCFKQIRTDDLMSYFKDYGPSYVEWLGELSCNVLFEDKYSAARAFHALSQELPTPPPLDLISARIEQRKNRNKDTIDDNNVDEAGDDMDATKEEEVGGADRDIVPSASEVEADGIAVNASNQEDGGIKGDDTMQPAEAKTLPDYGGMGWRFCKWTVRKVSNDRYGCRGTRARLLMRLATSNDVLDDRPTEWPKPPPGFSTKRKLMPWYDFSGKRRKGRGKRDTKRRRQDGRQLKWTPPERNMVDADGEHPLLSKGLRSGRDGFSMEELDAERNAKSAVNLLES